MSDGYFVRITRPYSDLSGLVHTWAARAVKVVVYEHIGDETEKTHIHMVIVKPDVGKKQLKNLVGSYNFNGNKDWSFKDYDGNETAMVYMTKGLLEPKFIKGYTQEDTDLWKSEYKPGREKPNRLLQLYEDTFDEEETDYHLREAVSAEYRRVGDRGCLDEKLIKFRLIKQIAKIAAFDASKRIWSQKTMNDYKSLVYTYILRHNMIIPPEEKDWAKFW